MINAPTTDKAAALKQAVLSEHDGDYDAALSAFAQVIKDITSPLLADREKAKRQIRTWHKSGTD